MGSLTKVGKLMYLYLEDIKAGNPIDVSEFILNNTAKMLTECEGHNWIPIIVKETKEDQYQVIGNSFIYQVALAAGLERAWCIIADNNPKTAEIAQVLAQEQMPKVNLCTASREDIKEGLKYIVAKHKKVFSGFATMKAVEKITIASRDKWADLQPITRLKCDIGKGEKLICLQDIFYVDPYEISQESNVQSTIPVTEEVTISIQRKPLEFMILKELKEEAKRRGLTGYSKYRKKDELLHWLTHQ